MTKGELEIDRRGLIYEAYRMELGPAECRAVFLDWAMGAPTAGPAEVAALLAHYGPAQPDHPMTAVLREGADCSVAPPARRRRPRED